MWGFFLADPGQADMPLQLAAIVYACVPRDRTEANWQPVRERRAANICVERHRLTDDLNHHAMTKNSMLFVSAVDGRDFAGLAKWLLIFKFPIFESSEF